MEIVSQEIIWVNFANVLLNPVIQYIETKISSEANNMFQVRSYCPTTLNLRAFRKSYVVKGDLWNPALRFPTPASEKWDNSCE